MADTTETDNLLVNTIDTQTAGTLTIGTNTATKVEIGNNGTVTEVMGTLDMGADGFIDLNDISAPVAPGSGTGRLYKKNGDNGLFWLPDSAGPEVDLTETGISDNSIFYDVYDSSGGQNFTGNVILNLDTERQNSGDFSLASDIITVNVTATLVFIIRVSTDISSGAARSTSRFELERDPGSSIFSVVPGSRGFMYNRLTPEGDNTATVALILDVNSGDRFRVRVSRNSGGDTITTITNASSVTIFNPGTQGIQGPQGLTGSGSTISVQNESANIPNTPNNILNFTGAGVTVTDGGSGSAIIDIPGGAGGVRNYGPSATDPMSPTPVAGDEYYNTVLNEKMIFDGSRAKWLSATSLFDGCGFNGNVGANGFYRRFNGMTLAANQGPFIQKGTIVRIGYATNNSVNHTIEVLVNGSVIATLSSGGASTSADNSINADFDQGVLSFRNQSGSGTTNNLQCTLTYKLRV